MKTYVGLDSEGYVEGIVHTTGACPPGYKEYPGPVDTVPSGINRDGSWFVLPPKPSIHHELNRQSREWFLPVKAAWAAVKAERNRRLLETDWLMLRAAETGVPVNSAWLDYRKALRDITEQADPNNIVWPLVPESV